MDEYTRVKSGVYWSKTLIDGRPRVRIHRYSGYNAALRPEVGWVACAYYTNEAPHSRTGRTGYVETASPDDWFMSSVGFLFRTLAAAKKYAKPHLGTSFV